MTSQPPPPAPPPPAPPPLVRDDRRWGLGDAGTALGIFLFSWVSMGFVVLFFEGDSRIDGPTLPIVLGAPAAAVLAYVLWVGRAKGRGAAADFGLRIVPHDLVVGAGLALTGLLGAGLVGSLQAALLDDDTSPTVAELARDSTDRGLTVWIVLLAVIAVTLVPVVEELVFRGLLWSALEKRGLRPGWCLVATSAAFAGFHLEPLRFFILLVLGLAIGYGRIRTSRIGPCIAAHAFINTIGMTFLLIDIA